MRTYLTLSELYLVYSKLTSIFYNSSKYILVNCLKIIRMTSRYV